MTQVADPRVGAGGGRGLRLAARLPPPQHVLVPPIAPFDRAPIRLFLTSATLLFVELFLIRWIPANVVYVGYFSNFLLMGSFLGIGLGILLGRGGWRPAIPLFPLLFFAVVKVTSGFQLNLQLDSPNTIYFGLTDQAKAADVNFLVLPLVFALVTVVMAALALPLGQLLRSMPPLRAYAVDIAGSLAGIAAFAGLAAFGTAPPVWIAVIAVLVGLLALGTGLTVWSWFNGFVMVVCILVAVALGDTWSPYQRITIYRTADSLALNVNGVPHQGFFLDPKRAFYGFYQQVDRWFPGRQFDDVLVVGAGTGNDTYFALVRGAKHIDAVEIDPAILQIGIDENPARPFQDPRVTRHVDDGRAFLARTNDRYDLVVFALPDSLTLVSSTANLRLESFLFTREAFVSVRGRLAPGGLFVLYNFYRQPWLLEKVAAMLEEAFGGPPIVRVLDEYKGTAAVLAAGPAIAALGSAHPPGDRIDPIDLSAAPGPATDDWPFLYVREPGIAPHYLLALGVVLLFAAVSVLGTARARSISVRRFSPHFFVLGVAFLLLETRSLVTFSLLFGNTWIVNALVFFAILASVLAAIAANALLPRRSPRLFYAGLFGALLLAYLLPPERLLIDPPLLRYALATALAFAPVFFANLVFSHSFRDTRTADMAFASNLLGAMVGGAIEYAALVIGYQALVLVVVILYGSAWFLATRWRRLADRELDLTPERAVASATM